MSTAHQLAGPARALTLPVLAAAAATFTVVTAEMLPVGLLTPLAAGLGVSPGTAGLAVTLPGFVAALAAPLLPAAARAVDRRTVLVALLALLAAAGVVSALAPHFAVLLAARVLVGVAIGGVWAIAAGIAPRLVPQAAVGRATAVVFSGIAVASVVGVPAGTFLGELLGWRWAFGAAALLAAAVGLLLACALPPLPAERGAGGLRTVLGAARLPAVRAGLLIVLLLVAGHFAAYTYVRPVLERVDGLAAGLVSGLLLAYGVAGIAGNFVGGALAPRDPRRTLLWISALLAAVVLALLAAGGSLLLSAGLLLLWGLAYGGVSVSTQNWMAAAAPAAGESVSALYAGVFNIAIALGALLGGRAADTFGADGALWLGGTLAALAAAATYGKRRAG
ncbi:MFS transporter [Streptomyces sp. Da 82-17]|uniref:MFS transporter n=1 Tax=Streptomyces sp. Da 82-17 TaxID=3377116 RepID=UPI0038D43611